MILLLGCAAADSAQGGAEDLLDTVTAALTPHTLTTGDVTYTLGWDTTGVTLGEGWTVAAEEGWTVQVTAAAITSFAASLVQCSDIVAWRPRLIAPAWAGHGGLNDPSTLESPVIEDFTAPTDTTLGALTFAEAEYCRVHWLVASAPMTAPGIETHPWMIDHTLALDGVATGPAGERRTLSLRSVDAEGAVVDVDADVSGAAQVRVVRALAGAFAGTDLAADSDDELAWAVLSNLAHATRVEVTPR